MSNIDTVKQIYSAFSRGEIPAILDKLDEQIEWDTEAAVAGVPWLQPRRGRANIAGFFASLAPLQFTHFEPHTFFESGNKVFVLVHIEATAHGKPYAIKNEGHYWTFGPGGKVASYQHVTDTLTHLRMARGE
jgi:ketosteroid isomerase-like protein